MAIVKMKRLTLLAMSGDRDQLLLRLQRLGCVDVSPPTDDLCQAETAGLLRPDTPDTGELESQAAAIQAALALLDRLAPEKTSLLAARPEVSLKELYNSGSAQTVLETAQRLNALNRQLSDLDAGLAKAEADLAALKPWLALDVPLSQTDTRYVHAQLLTVPAAATMEELRAALAEAADASALFEASTDRDLHYLLLLCHKSQAEAAAAALKPFGAGSVSFKPGSDTAAREAAALKARLEAQRADRQAAQEQAAAYKNMRPHLRLYADRLSQELARQAARARLVQTGSAFCLEGWVPETDLTRLEELLGRFDCAWELRDPAPEEYPQVPVKLHNNVFTRCLNVVTDMYSLPAYDGVDPNPLMAPFFIVFFGIMMADMAYGLLMIAAGLIYIKKARPREGTRNFMELVLWCGVTTFIMGALTGGFLGDFIPQLCKLINPQSTFQLPALFTPLNDTISIMLGSLVLGVIQIFTGMTVSVVEKCKKGEFIDALFSEITWWIILAGTALAVLGIGNVAGVPVLLLAGGLMLAIGGTRNARGFGKVTCLVGLVYNGVTGYFSDILSYVRLMALMLSGSVIAQVFNTLGSVFGNVVMFVIVSLVGNALNLALNLLGCYVHDLRLQCLEFFNRFYKEGGVAYQPLCIQTQSVDVIKEEQ